jgi:hypothetical protein
MGNDMIELNPRIIRFYDKHKIEWEFRTTKIVREITRTKIVSFIVQQPMNIFSEWIAKTDGKLLWKNGVRKFTSILTNDNPETDKQTEYFTIPPAKKTKKTKQKNKRT